MSWTPGRRDNDKNIVTQRSINPIQYTRTQCSKQDLKVNQTIYCSNYKCITKLFYQ